MKPAKPPIVPIPEEPRNPPPSHDTALAESKPDDSHILLRIVRLLLGVQGGPSRAVAMFAVFLMVNIWTVARFLVTAILALAVAFPRSDPNVAKLLDRLSQTRTMQCVEAPVEQPAESY